MLTCIFMYKPTYVYTYADMRIMISSNFYSVQKICLKKYEYFCILEYVVIICYYLKGMISYCDVRRNIFLEIIFYTYVHIRRINHLLVLFRIFLNYGTLRYAKLWYRYRTELQVFFFKLPCS